MIWNVESIVIESEQFPFHLDFVRDSRTSENLFLCIKVMNDTFGICNHSN